MWNPYVGTTGPSLALRTRVIVSIYPPGARDNGAAVHHEMSWPAFAVWLATPLDTADKHAQGYSPLLVRPGRGGRTSPPASFLALEYDGTATQDALAAAMRLFTDHDAVLHTTASATRACPRFRVVVRPSRPIATEGEWHSCVTHTERLIGVPAAPESKQISRLWYRPIRGCEVRLCAGAPWDVDASLAACPPPPPRPPVPMRTEDELARWPLGLRLAQAWDALDRRRPAGAYNCACVCHDYGLPEDKAAAMVMAHGARDGWTDLDVDAINERVEHAYDYARDPFGHALIATVGSHPDLRARIARLVGMEAGR